MKKILIVLAVVAIIIQFFQIEKTNPTVNQGMDFLTIKKTPEPIANMIRSSCYNCHSNETKYPAYSYIQPFGWFLKSHIEDGRKHLNFSVFATYEPKRQAHKLKEAAEEIEKGGMPLESYLLIHNEANLTAQQRKDLIQYFKTIEAETRTAYRLPPE